MKVYDKIKSMNTTELAQFISDLLCGNPNETADGFGHFLCCDCEAAGYVSYGEIYDCDYSSGNCSDVDRVKEWLESEVESDTEVRTAIISMSIDDEDVVSEIHVQGLTNCEFITGVIAVLATVLNQAELSEYERDIFKIRLTDILKLLESEVEENA